MTAVEQLQRRLEQLPGDQREAMAAQVLSEWDALQWDMQAGATRVETGEGDSSAEETDAQPGRSSRSPAEPVPYERIEHLVGSIEGPGDLSTNPKYMEGFGESNR